MVEIPEEDGLSYITAPHHSIPHKRAITFVLWRTCWESILLLASDLSITPLIHLIECGAPPVDWEKAQDSKTPKGWTNMGLENRVDDYANCASRWNGFSNGNVEGQLYATMKGSGRATVEYKDCLGKGFVALYLNGKQIDKSPESSGELRTFRCSEHST